MRTRLFLLAVIASAALLPGCTTTSAPPSKPVVRIDPAQIAKPPQGVPPLAKVEMIDQRPRMAGDYVFVPSDLQLIQSIVQAKADQALMRQRRTQAPDPIVVAVQQFRVDTQEQGMERNVSAHIRAVIRTAGENMVLVGEATEQTYTPPTTATIQRVVTQALQQMADNAEQAMKIALAPK